MRPETASFRLLRRGWTSATIVVLLGAAAVAGDREFFGVLRGEQDTTEAAPLGYYEGLLHAPGAAGVAQAMGPPPGWVAFGAPEAGLVEEVPSYQRWRMRPNLDTTWNGSVFRTNGLGYRSPEVTVKKPRGTYRILVFGSSNSMGYGIGNDEMYTLLLERWLNQQAGRPNAVEVVNLAVSGDSPSRRLYRMQQEAERLDPDWILCDISFFDPWLEDRQVQAAIDRTLPIPFPFVEDAIRRTGARGGVSVQEFSESFRGESERLLEDVFAGWASESRRLGVPLTLVVLPRSDSKDKSTRLQAVIHSLAARNALDCLDISDGFDGLRVEEFRISEWDKHPSAGGHRAVFEAIRDALIARGGLPSGAPER
jgi:GDSL-like Lipase/Acylhydrolase family